MATINQYVSKTSRNVSTSTHKRDIVARTDSTRTVVRINKKLLRDTHSDDTHVELTGVTARRLSQVLLRHFAGMSKAGKYTMISKEEVQNLRRIARQARQSGVGRE